MGKTLETNRDARAWVRQVTGSLKPRAGPLVNDCIHGWPGTVLQCALGSCGSHRHSRDAMLLTLGTYLE